jgi:hypothetical protein
LDGQRHRLGSTKTEADKRFRTLIRKPAEQRVAAPESIAGIIDVFLK